MIKHFFQIVSIVILGWSCSDEPVETVFFDLDNEDGVFISCEGNFMYGNGSLSFYNFRNKIVTNRLFYARNNAPLGDVVLSLASYGNSMFIVVNNSGKIYVVDPVTVGFRGMISGLTSPRHIHFVSDDKAYVSDLYAKHITVVDPLSLQKTGRINLNGHTSEQMVQFGKYVFVSSWSNEEHLLVIDSEKDEMVEKIKVPVQPKDLELDKNGKIWVLSEGSYEEALEEAGAPALSRIDPQTFTVEQIYRFTTEHRPSCLEINSMGDTLYYINGGVRKMAVNSRQLPESAFISEGDRLFYSIAIQPTTNDIYVADAIDYTQDAIVYRYNETGSLIDTFQTGINPSGFLFRQVDASER